MGQSSRRKKQQAGRRRQVVGRRRTVTPWVLGAVAIAVVALAAFGVTQATGGGSGGNNPSATPGPPQPLAGLAGQAGGQSVDGIQCESMEGAVLHVHSHLAVYVDGEQRIIPAGVGIPNPQLAQTATGGPYASASGCLYWLHTHTQDGVLHIESPTQRAFTLGQLFDIWNQPLSATAVGPARGVVTMYVDGRRFTGDPRSIALGAHTLVQLDVGKDVAPQPFSFPPNE